MITDILNYALKLQALLGRSINNSSENESIVLIASFVFRGKFLHQTQQCVSKTMLTLPRFAPVKGQWSRFISGI